MILYYKSISENSYIPKIHVSKYGYWLPSGNLTFFPRSTMFQWVNPLNFDWAMFNSYVHRLGVEVHMPINRHQHASTYLYIYITLIILNLLISKYVYIYIIIHCVYIYIYIYYHTSYIGQCLTHTVYAPWTVSIYRFTQYAGVIAMWIILWLSEGKWELSHTCATNIKYTN